MTHPSKKHWIKAGAFSMGSRFSVLIFGFGGFYFLIRTLSLADFGTWSLFIAITTVVEMSKNGLIQNAMIKFLHSNDDSESSKIISATWVINLAFSLVIYIILVLFADFFADIFGASQIRNMFLYYGLTLLLLVPLSQFNYIQQSKSSFAGIFLSAFARQGSFFWAILAIYLLKTPISLEFLVLVHAMCTLIGVIVAYVSARTFITFKFDWDWLMLKRIFSFGKYIMGTNICSLFFKNVDQFTIGYFLNTSGVALYNSAIRLSNLIEYPATSVAEVVYPHSTARIQEDGESVTKIIYEKSVAVTLSITVPIVVVTFLFSDLIILLIAGSAYADASAILRVTILFGLFTPFNRQFGMAMDSSGRPARNFMVLAIGLCLNIASNVILVKEFGIMGAAYGTLLSYLFIFLIGHFMLVRTFQVRFANIFAYMTTYYQMAIEFAFNTGKRKLGWYDKK